MEKPLRKTHFILGRVTSPFGLKGFVKIKSYSGETGHFFHLDKVRLKKGEKEENRDVAEVIPHGNGLLMRFAGIGSPESAEALNGAEIIVERKFASPLKDGEFYIEDLKGLEVVNKDGETLGHISDVLEGGGGYLAELELLPGNPRDPGDPGDRQGGKRLVPFRDEFFGELNPNNGKIALLETWILQ